MVFKRAVYLLIAVLCLIKLQAQETPLPEQGVNSPVLVKRHPFIDTLTTDSLYRQVLNRCSPKMNATPLPKVTEKFSPFEHKAYKRYSIGKFWFFVVSLLILVVFVYYRNIFTKQLINRVKGLYSRYYFNELLSDTGTSLATGSLWAVILFILIFAQYMVVGLSYMKYHKLANNINFYVVLIVVVALWKLVLLVVQRLQSFVIDGQDMLKAQWQRQISIDLIYFLLIFPLLNLVYYNSSKMQGIAVGQLCFAGFILWLVLRTLAAFVGMIRDGAVSFKFILYFCAFEILPHGILFSALYRAYI